jgi:mRNA interferase RelE/StbE
VKYQVELTPAARRDLKILSRDVLKRIDAHILALADDPYPAQARKLQGGKNLFRVRVGDYRIIYTVEKRRLAILVILVIRVGHRREIYRK